MKVSSQKLQNSLIHENEIAKIEEELDKAAQSAKDLQELRDYRFRLDGKVYEYFIAK